MSSAADRGGSEGLLIGLGHAERQDDGVGPFVARELQRRGFPAVVHSGDGTALLDLWDGQPVCVVVDAMAAPGAEPGALRVFTDFEDPGFQRAGFVHSTHRLGLPEAVALGRTLGRLPGRLVVVG
ncbi:MAG TPA: hydrogenase maturation protease, partial [Kiloniellaceae bacterium]|nr:hydrogenase maturation protease [Kiloniellaceae bacterium]